MEMMRSNYKSLVMLSTIVLLLLSTLIALNSSFHGDGDGDEQIRQAEAEAWQFVPIGGGGGVGPESFAFNDVGEGPFSGVSDGRIMRWDEKHQRWIHFAHTSSNRNGCKGPEDEHICGRPLGLCFNGISGDLYIADAYKGLMVVGPNGGSAYEVATQARGIDFGFTNGLDIDQHNGLVYFTDSSSRYQRRNYLSLILSEDKTGRLMKYDPVTQNVTVLVDNLSFPNGVTLSEDGNSVLVVETTYCRVVKYWLKTPKAGTLEVFSRLPGFADNIKKSPRGGFWVGVHSKRLKFVELALSFPWIRNAMLKLPVDIMKLYTHIVRWRGRGMAVRLSEEGDVLEILEKNGSNILRSVSEVEEKDGKLWIGSVNMPFAIVKKV